MSIPLFIVSLYHYALSGSPLIKSLPALALSLRADDNLLKIALLCAGVGDLFLAMNSTFLLGIVSFAGAQISLLRLFEAQQIYLKPSLIILSSGIVLSPLLNWFSIPIILYSLLSVHLLIESWNRVDTNLGKGIILFILTDIMFLIEFILETGTLQNHEVIPRSSLSRTLQSFSLPLYWSALFLMVQ